MVILVIGLQKRKLTPFHLNYDYIAENGMCISTKKIHGLKQQAGKEHAYLCQSLPILSSKWLKITVVFVTLASPHQLPQFWRIFFFFRKYTMNVLKYIQILYFLSKLQHRSCKHCTALFHNAHKSHFE